MLATKLHLVYPSFHNLFVHGAYHFPVSLKVFLALFINIYVEYDTKWALLDLSMNPDKQDKLRAELKTFTKVDPTYDDFTNGLPYLDAVVREVIRLHPLDETTRVVRIIPTIAVTVSLWSLS